jgi:F-type H+-transporting ATPase subunit epsilon
MSFELTIVTPEGEAFRGPVQRVVFPGSEGEFGVLEGHERFLTPLRIGEVSVIQNGETRFAAMSGGFADVGPDAVVAMVETCELAEEIDVARAEAARDRARSELDKLSASQAEEHSYKMQEQALQRALVRLQAASRRAR